MRNAAGPMGASLPPPALGGALLLVGWALFSCSHGPPQALHQPPLTATSTTAGPNQSMIHLARVGTGVVAVDLGWWGAEDALASALASLSANEDDVVAVFLTHPHRDHVGAWRAVRHAPFVIGEPDVALFLGERDPRGLIPRVAEKLLGSDLPGRGEVELLPFVSDTAFGFGPDTVHAFRVPGHTEGSAAYLLRGTLFVGDAVAYTPTGGFQPAFAAYSDDSSRARASLHTLRARLARFDIDQVCTAHARCAPADSTFWHEVLDRW